MADLNTKLQYIKGVGPKISASLDKLGLETIQDLFFYYPRTYKDFTSITKIRDLPERDTGESYTIKGKILGISNKKTSRRRFTVTEAIIEDGTGSIKIVWFNQPFLSKMLLVGQEILINGRITYNFYTQEVVMESPERASKASIIPVYGETAGLTSKYISKLLDGVSSFSNDIEEFLPEEILDNYSLLGIKEAIKNIHNPKDLTLLGKARRRIAFDELFFVALRAQVSKQEIQKENGPKIEISQKIVDDFIDKLPFKLTDDQKKATDQILLDLKKAVPMNRLLNGDVGSGKTVVAAIAALASIRAGYNVALMAPTEILANQHFETFKKLFDSKYLGILTASRKEYSDQTKIFVGTHALIQESVFIQNLGLVIVDEQHRFGVKQRAALSELAQSKKRKAKGSSNGLSALSLKLSASVEVKPHFLSMTATPIPRTLHLALFGDLDLSVIKEKPADRKEIKTRFVEPHNRNKAYEFIRAHLEAGRQAFVICPLIEIAESDSDSLFEDERKSVKAEHEKLKKIFPEFEIGMLHGRMKGKEKDEVMRNFAANQTQLLVSTSVVEVGVDVPNASVMIIEDAERFGLAQLHQFRGRVGRSEYQSFCFLFSSTMSDKAIKRLKALESTSDGFRLAEIDLETRGPGAVFGTEQSGLLDLKMADFSDRVLVEEASSAAKSIVEVDPELRDHSLLKEKIADYLNNKHLE